MDGTFKSYKALEETSAIERERERMGEQVDRKVQKIRGKACG